VPGLVEDDPEVEILPAVPSQPLATLLYSGSAAEVMDVSPLSAAIARHMGINLSPEGVAARNRRGIAIIVHGAPLSGIALALIILIILLYSLSNTPLQLFRPTCSYHQCLMLAALCWWA